MWKPHPETWLRWALPMVALPTFAAFWLNTSTLIREISARSTQQLFAIGANWAVPTFNGRDAILSGDAPSQEAIDTALDALAGVYGVRTVTNNARIVAPPPVSLVAPRIKSLASNSALPENTGTWQEGAAKTFSVSLAGKVYKFGTDPKLSSGAEAYVLTPAVALADGAYDVTARVSMKAEIVGHADFVGPRLYNQARSEARAQSVISALAAAGVEGQRLRTQGFGERMPADTEKTIAARQKNRRVEITLAK